MKSKKKVVVFVKPKGRHRTWPREGDNTLSWCVVNVVRGVVAGWQLTEKNATYAIPADKVSSVKKQWLQDWSHRKWRFLVREVTE